MDPSSMVAALYVTVNCQQGLVFLSDLLIGLHSYTIKLEMISQGNRLARTHSKNSHFFSHI